MTRIIRYTGFSIAAIAAGVISLASDAWQNLQWALEKSGSWTDPTIGLVVAAFVGAAVASLLLGRSVAQNRYGEAATYALTWFACALFSLLISTERLAMQRADAAFERTVAAQTLKRLRGKLSRAYAHAETYCTANVRKRSRAEYEKKCTYWKGEISGNIGAIKISKRVVSGPVLGETIRMLASIVGVSVNPNHVEPIVSILGPLAVLLSGLFLTAGGARGEIVVLSGALQRQGRNADLDRARGIEREWQLAHRCRPTVAELAAEMDISEGRARTLHKAVVSA